MKFVLPILLLFLGMQLAMARPVQVILIRHAEKPEDESNPHLSKVGEERARALVSCLTTNSQLLIHDLPVVLVAAQPTKRGRGLRAFETLTPLAKHLRLDINTPFRAEDYAALASEVLNHPDYDGKVVVICWVHNYLSQLTSALGVKPRPPSWKESVYDRIWVIRYRNGKAAFSVCRQGILPGDSPRNK
jgi:hypothetical protein